MKQIIKNTTGRNIIKTVLFCVICGIVLFRLYRIISWKDTAGEFYSSVDSFYELPKDSVEVLFFGSSHSYCSVNISQLWKEQGIPAFNLAISGQDLAGSYYGMKEALKYQKPKVICLDVYGVTFHGYQVEGNLYRNLLPYRISRNYVQEVQDLVETDNKLDFLLKWPIVHTRYKELVKNDFMLTKVPYLGYYCEFYSQPVDLYGCGVSIYQNGETKKIAAEEEEWLRKIIALSKEEGFELVLFLTPYAASEDAHRMYNEVNRIAQSEDVPFLNLFKAMGILEMDTEKDFVDWGHTNYWGAKKVTAYLREYLSENYSLSDRRNTKGFEIWDEDLRVREHEEINDRVRRTNNILSFQNVIGLADGYTLIISTNGAYINDSFAVFDYLEEFGLDLQELENGGVWVISDEKSMYHPQKDSYLYTTDIGSRSLSIVMNAEGNHVYTDRSDCIRTLNGINIIVYDEVLDRVADVIGLDARNEYHFVR